MSEKSNSFRALLSKSGATLTNQSYPLVIGFSQDVGHLAPHVIDYLQRFLNSHLLLEISDNDNFIGAILKGDTLEMIKSSLYFSSQYNILLLESDNIGDNFYELRNTLLKLAESIRLREVYIISAFTSSNNLPQKLLGIFTDFKTQKRYLKSEDFQNFDLVESQEGLMSNYLLWVLKNKGIPGIGIWAILPPYLEGIGDPRTEKRVLQFLNRHLELNLELQELDRRIRDRDLKIAGLRTFNPEVNRIFQKISNGNNLSEEEEKMLVEKLRKSNDKL